MTPSYHQFVERVARLRAGRAACEGAAVISDARSGGAIWATLKGALYRLSDRDPPLALDEADRLDGRAALVTGASRGLGLAIARALVRRGARVLACVRSDAGALAGDPAVVTHRL